MCELLSKQLDACSAWVILIDRFCWVLLVQSPNLPGSALPGSSTGLETSSGNAILLPARHKNLLLFLPVLYCNMQIFPLMENINIFSPQKKCLRLLLLCPQENAVFSKS